MSGHGADEKYRWVHTRYGERVKTRRVYWEEIDKFSSPIRFYGILAGLTGLWMLIALFGTTLTSFAALVCPMAVVVIVVGGLEEYQTTGVVIWREIFYVVGVEWLFAQLAEGQPGAIVSVDGAIATLAVVVSLTWYNVWSVRRAVWEPLAAALSFTALLWGFVLAPQYAVVIAIALLLIGAGFVLFGAGVYRDEHERHHQAMQHID